MATNRQSPTSDGEQTPPSPLPEQLLFFIFCNGEEVYAVHPDTVVEVVSTATSTPVPFTPEWIEGVVSVRGEIVPVLDLHRYLGMSSDSKPAQRRLILFNVNNTSFTLWSNRIVGVETITGDQLEPPLATLPTSLLGCARGQFRHKDRLVTVIDLSRLLEESRQQVKKR